jgi:hypothetical protein
VRALVVRRRKKERRRARAGDRGELGRAWPTRGKRERGGLGCQGEKGPAQGEEGKESRPGYYWTGFSSPFLFPFSISFPDFQTKIHLNSNGI